MNNTYSDRLNMFNAVLSVCDSYPTAVESIKVLKDGVELLRRDNQILHEMLSEQTQSSTTLLTSTKNETRDRAFEAGLQIAKRIRSAAMRLDQPLLTDQLIFTSSGMKAMTEKEQLFRLKSILERAESNIELLRDWGFDKAMTNDFRLQITAFETLSGAPTDKINERAARTETLEAGITKLLNFIKNDLNLLVDSMNMQAEGQFMRQFQRAARIRATGGGGGLLVGSSASTATKQKAQKQLKPTNNKVQTPVKMPEPSIAPVLLEKTTTNVSTALLPLEGQIFSKVGMQ
jgi:hypothetical protein